MPPKKKFDRENWNVPSILGRCLYVHVPNRHCSTDDSSEVAEGIIYEFVCWYMEHLGETHFWNIRNGNNLKMFTECEVCVKMVSIVAHLLRQQWSNIIKCINFDDSYISDFLKKKNLSSRRPFPKWGYPEKSIQNHPKLSQIYPKSSRETICKPRWRGHRRGVWGCASGSSTWTWLRWR